MMIKPRRVVIIHLGAECVVEIDNGPFKFDLFAGDDKEYYEGWIIPQPFDPCDQPCHVIFEKASIKREA
jgi:hypothetical protein